MSDAATPNSSWDPEAKGAAATGERGFLAELLAFAWENKAWWIVPTVVILAGLGVLVFVCQQDSIAPFFYALF